VKLLERMVEEILQEIRTVTMCDIVILGSFLVKNPSQRELVEILNLSVVEMEKKCNAGNTH
jgi:hypothetical protein